MRAAAGQRCRRSSSSARSCMAVTPTDSAPGRRVDIGESLVGDGNEVAHIDLIIGSKSGPAGTAFTHALPTPTDGFSTLLAVVDPGDEVIVLEPFYENYGPDADIAGAKPVYVALRPPHNVFDPDELRRAFSPRTKAIIVNTPNNPTGRVFTRQELSLIAELCVEHDVIAITDEIYEHIKYEGEHIPIATLPGMRDRTVTINSLMNVGRWSGVTGDTGADQGRGNGTVVQGGTSTVTINGMSKTYSVTGWRAYLRDPGDPPGALNQ